MPSKDRMRRNKKDINKYYEIKKDVILSEKKEKYDKHLLAPLKSTKTSLIKNLKV